MCYFGTALGHFIFDLEEKSLSSLMRYTVCTATELSVGDHVEQLRHSPCPPGANSEDEEHNKVRKHCDEINTGTCENTYRQALEVSAWITRGHR